MSTTKIQWCDKVWNPVTGCTKVSEGCRNCYAEGIAKRFWGERKFTDVQFHLERMDEPSHWRKPAKIFVNSMSDLFHPDVPDGFIFGCFMRMATANRHTFIILTKRPERMRDWIKNNWMTDIDEVYNKELILDNVWLGVSVEDQKTADERIPILLQTPAAVRFVSIEPMLESISLGGFDGKTYRPWLDYHAQKVMIDWVICGGESGSSARPHPHYIDILNLKNQCVSAGVPFFLKQMWGKKMPELDGQTWKQYPEVK
jgi:protein gp37